jgi:hypothetical protein
MNSATWWVMADADLFREKHIVGWLVFGADLL